MIHVPHRRPNKLLGQHFLISKEVLRKIVTAAKIGNSDTILEIGPGKGILTRELAARASRVIAVEKDRELASELAQTLAAENITNVAIVPGDILKYAPRDLGLPERFSVIANIPYYLTGKLIRVLLERTPRPESIVLMVQKEVAERMTAQHPHMNLLAISVQAYGTARIIAGVPASAFAPQPKVDSAIIKIADIGDIFFLRNEISPESFFRIARGAFRYRRKTLANALGMALPQASSEITEYIRRAGIPPETRPETLTLEEWARLTKVLKTPHDTVK